MEIPSLDPIKRQKDFDKERVKEKKIKSGLRKCPGHWINKRFNVKDDTYDDYGKCFKCGGWKK